jgi:protein-S-isoprenylcysteine O-methyltransferase Ste14
MSQDKEVPGVIAPPPVIFLLFLIAGMVADVMWITSAPAIDPAPRWYASATLLLAALVIIVLAVGGFRRAGTPVPTRAPTSALVTSGAHALSRNPIYIALFLFYFGIAAAMNSWGMLALALPLFAVIRYGVVAREEAYLERKFGEDYIAYKSRVPRWL